MAGLAVTADALNALAGSIALQLKSAFRTAVDINTWLTAHPVVGAVDPLTLAPYLLSALDASTIRTAYADLAYMKATAFDSSQAVKALWGLGE